MCRTGNAKWFLRMAGGGTPNPPRVAAMTRSPGAHGGSVPAVEGKASSSAPTASCHGPAETSYRRREVGGGRNTRQLGQVRKEAALTRPLRVSVQSPTYSIADISLRDAPHARGPYTEGRIAMDEASSQPLPPSDGYRVLARKYRPSTFDDLIGQEPMVRTLSNAFETGRIHQAYMLTGVRGVGKTTTARNLY